MAWGCALKAPQQRAELQEQALPNLAVPAQWAEKGGAAGAVANGWLAAFNDPRLDALVREAIANNPDLRVAAARVEQAAGYVRLAGATLYPQVNLLARGGGSLSGDSSGLQGVGIFASWELDLWGRVRAGREAAQLQYLSAALDADYAWHSIAALVAKSWFLATEARLQKAAVEDMMRSAERLVGLAQDRMRVGKGDEYDVTLAQANLQTYRDAVQQFDLSYRQALRALEALIGRYPAAAVDVPPRLAAKPGPVPVGIPAELLERRPDVVAAERRVAAAFYRTEEAKAARLPRISLTAAATTRSGAQGRACWRRSTSAARCSHRWRSARPSRSWRWPSTVASARGHSVRWRAPCRPPSRWRSAPRYWRGRCRKTSARSSLQTCVTAWDQGICARFSSSSSPSMARAPRCCA